MSGLHDLLAAVAASWKTLYAAGAFFAWVFVAYALVTAAAVMDLWLLAKARDMPLATAMIASMNLSNAYRKVRTRGETRTQRIVRDVLHVIPRIVLLWTVWQVIWHRLRGNTPYMAQTMQRWQRVILEDDMQRTPEGTEGGGQP